MDIGILMTGTIIPQSNYVVVKSSEQRRHEYLKAIEFYREFAPVWFAENSAYDVENDDEFRKWDDVHIIKCRKPYEYSKGKGYQEFKMIDECLSGGGTFLTG